MYEIVQRQAISGDIPSERISVSIERGKENATSRAGSMMTSQVKQKSSRAHTRRL
jgi:hypothetical protein